MPPLLRFVVPVIAAVLLTVPSIAQSPAPGDPDVDARIRTAFNFAYNLDQPLAVAEARALVAAAPNESRAHRALASVLWLEILFKRGAVTIDSYLGGVTRAYLSLPKPQPELDAEFKRELNLAISLAEARLKQTPRDVGARYDVGTAYGLEASYVASVEGRMTSAFMAGKRAFDAAEDVLNRDPNRVGAGTIVGTYRYLVSSLGMTARMFAYMVGFGGGKERGIQLVDAAARDPRVRVEAKTALMLIYAREGRDTDALLLLRELAAEFPRNRLFVLEQGSAALRAGRYAEAYETLDRGIEQLDRDNRQKMPGERALWLYKRAQAELRLARPAAAAADLDAALKAAPVEWVRGRILLEQGRLADLSGRRDDALASYRAAKAISDAIVDPIASVEAARLQKEPFALRPSRAGG